MLYKEEMTIRMKMLFSLSLFLYAKLLYKKPILAVALFLFILPFFIPQNIERITYPLIHRKTSGNIPLLLFRCSKSSTVNFYVKRYCFDRWVSLNPDYTMYWISDEDNFFKMRRRVLNAYNKLIPGAYRADLWRAFVLYKHGGVYVDCHTVPIKSLRDILRGKMRGNHSFISISDTVSNSIHNGFIACSPRHPFLKTYLVFMLRNIEKNYYGRSPLDITGPTLLFKSMRKCLNRKGFSPLFKTGFNDYSDLSFYLYKHNYGPYQNITDKNGEVVMYKKYSFLSYLYEKSKENNYTTLWNARKVFKV